MSIASPKSIAAAVAVGLFAVSIFLLSQRGGILAWVGAGVALLLLTKIFIWPSASDARTSTVAFLIWGLAWLGTWQYVKHTWESGEVVELSIKTPSGTKTARVWVVDLHGKSSVYYDSPPDLARELLAGTAVSMSRGGSSVSGCASAVEVSSLSEETQTEFFALMNDKYGHQNIATEVFYSVLGGNRKRVPVLMHVTNC